MQSHHKSPTHYDVIVIGSGLGGLTAGALAAKSGAKVLVLERHSKFGGAATAFSRRSMQIEVGLHALDGLDPLDRKRALFAELGLLDKLNFVDIPHFYAVHAPHLGGPFGNSDLVMPHGIASACAAMTEKFPHQAPRLKKWFFLIDTIRKNVGLLEASERNFAWWLRHTVLLPLQLWPILRYQKASVADVLGHLFGEDEAVKLALCANLTFYGLHPKSVSFLHFCVAQGSYLVGGSHYIKGGSQVLSDHLIELIIQHGGDAQNTRHVDKILVEHGRAIGVVHCHTRGRDDAREAFAPIIFANTAPQNITTMLPDECRSAWKGLYESRPLSPSAWVIYLGLNAPPDQLGIDHYETFIVPPWCENIAALADSPNVMAHLPDATHRRPYYTVTNFNHIDAGLWHKKSYLLELFGLDLLKNWEHLDQASYEAKKAAWMNALVADLQRHFPATTGKVIYREMATPRTMQHYLNTPEGAIYGYEQSPQLSGLRRPAASTPIAGLFLASAFTRPGGGFSGVMRAGISAFRAAVKHNGWSAAHLGRKS